MKSGFLSRLKLFSRSDENAPSLGQTLLYIGGFTLSAYALFWVIFWNADFYAARDRWEHFKSAIFGEWHGRHLCPDWVQSRHCDDVHAFEAAFAAAQDFTFFQSVPIKGSRLKVITGVRFATAKDVLNAKPQNQWCYINYGFGTVTQRLDLAEKAEQDKIVYSNLDAVPPDELAKIKLGLEQLQTLSRTHCRFDAVGIPLKDDSQEGKTS